MGIALPIMLRNVDEPEEWIFETDGVSIKQMHLKEKGWMVKQHVHKYDHYTLLATGSMRVWVEDVQLADFIAPTGIFIEAGKRHTMQALEDNTVAYCIHNTSRRGAVEILADK